MREQPSAMTVKHAALVAQLTPEERAALAAELLAANVREAVGEVLASTARAHRDADPLGRGEFGDGAPVAMNPQQAAAYCAIGVNRLRDLLRAGVIQGRRSGRRWLVRREALDEWMTQEEERERQRRRGVLAGRRGQREARLG